METSTGHDPLPGTRKAKAGTTYTKLSFCCLHSEEAPLGAKKEQRSRWDVQTQGKAGPLGAKVAFKCRFILSNATEPRIAEA